MQPRWLVASLSGDHIPWDCDPYRIVGYRIDWRCNGRPDSLYGWQDYQSPFEF